MILNVLRPVEINIAYLAVTIEDPRWDCFVINNQPNKDGIGHPWKTNSRNELNFIVEVDTGKILSWKKGQKGIVEAKVCDSGTYKLLNSYFNTIVKAENCYVPNVFDIESDGYGDYMSFDVNEEGYIVGWDKELVRNILENEDGVTWCE